MLVAEEPKFKVKPKAKKALNRRFSPDRSQATRRAVQWFFMALNVWIGIEFFLWVRFWESGGRTVYVDRPAGVEGWLPIASLMNLKLWIDTGAVATVHPAGMFLIVSFIAICFFFRKAFCSWICPIGTLSEYLWKLGRQTFRRNWRLPRWLDIPLRSLKFILLGLFLYVILRMSPVAIRAFMEGPYGIISDVKMLNFFRFMSVTAAVACAVLVVLSVFIQNFWCRFLCPYGALMGLFSWLSPARIRRDPVACIDCAKCAKACPAQLKVDQLIQIRSMECTACLECVAVCPAEGALQLTVANRRELPAWAVAAGIAVLFLGITAYARVAGYWHTNLPDRIYYELVPRAAEFGHP